MYWLRKCLPNKLLRRSYVKDKDAKALAATSEIVFYNFMILLQKHHGAREVFLTDSADNNTIDCLERAVPVCLPSAVHQFDSHPDVYTCEYEYDIAWKVSAPLLT